MIIETDALFVEIPKQFNASVWENRRLNDADIRFVHSRANRFGSNAWLRIAHAIRLTARDSPSQFGIRFFDKLNCSSPALRPFLQQTQGRGAIALRIRDGLPAPRNSRRHATRKN